MAVATGVLGPLVARSEACLDMDVVATPVVGARDMKGLMDVTHHVDHKLERDEAGLLRRAAVEDLARVVQESASVAYILLAIPSPVEGASMTRVIDVVQGLAPPAYGAVVEVIAPSGGVGKRRGSEVLQQDVLDLGVQEPVRDMRHDHVAIWTPRLAPACEAPEQRDEERRARHRLLSPRVVGPNRPANTNTKVLQENGT
mmetsp:Transcript_15543/g.38841  ORF Transcript_15543/g.38841 Transcript_15543/m.38841 type:complete len:200 (-) Transcript_15543:8-607(-)